MTTLYRGCVDELGSDIYNINQTVPGRCVVDLQRRLIMSGFLEVGCVDGVFAHKTHDAICAVQRSASLSVTGVADHKTQEALSQILSGTIVVNREKELVKHAIVEDVPFIFQGNAEWGETILQLNAGFNQVGSLISCLSMVMSFHMKRTVAPNDLEKHIRMHDGFHPDSVNLSTALTYGSKTGFTLDYSFAAIQRVEILEGYVLRERLPFILSVNLSKPFTTHYVVVIGITASGILMHDPGTPKGNGYKFYPRNFVGLTKRFGGYAINTLYIVTAQ